MALADFLKTINQPSGVTPLQSSIGQPNIPMQGKKTPSPFGDMSSGLNDRLRLMLYALGGALKGESPLQAGLGFQQFTQQQKLEEEAKKRKERLEGLAKTDPNLGKMYELFGEKGLQQGYLRQLDQQAEQQNLQNQLNAASQAGVSRSGLNLLAAGLPLEDVVKYEQEKGLALSGPQVIESIDESVENFVEEADLKNVYSDLGQAFSPADALQEQANKVTRFLGGVDIAPATGAAVRARDNLNLEILATLANDYTGRPSNLLLTEIKKVLPESSATSEKDAFEKYTNIKNQTESRIKNLEQGLQSTTLSETKKESYREELYKSKVLLKKLDAALLGLEKNPEITLKPADLNMQTAGQYSWIYDQ